MSKILIGFLILVPGLLNFAPLVGVLGRGRLQALYQAPITDDTVLLLLRHRALMFAVVGGFMIAAAFQPHLWLTAITMGLVSMLGFVLLAWQVGRPNSAIKKVVAADVVGALMLGLALYLIKI